MMTLTPTNALISSAVVGYHFMSGLFACLCCAYRLVSSARQSKKDVSQKRLKSSSVVAFGSSPGHKSCLRHQQAFSPYPSPLILCQLTKGGRGVVEGGNLCLWYPAGQQVPSHLQDWQAVYQAEAWGYPANYRRGINLSLFGLTNARLLFCHPT